MATAARTLSAEGTERRTGGRRCCPGTRLRQQEGTLHARQFALRGRTLYEQGNIGRRGRLERHGSPDKLRAGMGANLRRGLACLPRRLLCGEHARRGLESHQGEVCRDAALRQDAPRPELPHWRDDCRTGLRTRLCQPRRICQARTYRHGIAGCRAEPR